MPVEAIVTICIFIAVQTGGLIYYAGVVTTTLRDHDKRIGVVEDRSERTAITVARLEKA